jgi:hypothetical protein
MDKASRTLEGVESMVEIRAMDGADAKPQTVKTIAAMHIVCLRKETANVCQGSFPEETQSRGFHGRHSRHE